jgi:tryptophan-rich sensory protein
MLKATGLILFPNILSALVIRIKEVDETTYVLQFNPPGWVFVVWPCLYLLLGIALNICRGYASYGKYIDVSRRAECLVVGLRQPMLSSFIDRYPIDALLFFTSAIAADLYANHYLTASYCIMPLVAWFVVRMRLVVPIRHRDRRISIYRRHVHTTYRKYG